MKRQLDDYYDKFYTKEALRFKELSANNNQVAKELAQWKETVAERWDAIHVVSSENNIPEEGPLSGMKYTFRVVIDEQGLDDAIGLEYVSVKTDANGEEHINAVHPFSVVSKDGNLYTFEATFESDNAGSYKTAIRMFPKNDKLPHRQDFAYVRWLEY